MDFTIPEDIRHMQELTRRFVKEEILPREEEMEETDNVPEDIVKKLKELGFFGVTMPKEYGGLGIGTLGWSIMNIELGKGHPAIGGFLSLNNGTGWRGLYLYGREDQKQKYLPKIASGDIITAFGLTEPGAGSDAASIQTNAVKDGDNYIINGRKHFISNGPIADLVTVMVVTDKAKRARGGISAFLVEKGTPGFRPGQTHRKMGNKGAQQSELIFEDCVIPASNMVGNLGDGFKVAMCTLDETRLTVLAGAVGMAERCLEMSRDYAKIRVQFGKPIAEFQAIQWMLADMATEIYAAKMMLYNAAWRYDQGERITREAAMFKLFASEMVCRCADRALQVHGGMGYMKELPIERIYRDARLLRIVDGTSEIQKLVIARDILKEG